jgi:hypothetical protein
VLAAQLGRWFEARVCLTLASARKTRKVDLEGVVVALKRHTDAINDSGQTLAAALAAEIDSGTHTNGEAPAR